jgi:hypothetical protein
MRTAILTATLLLLTAGHTSAATFPANRPSTTNNDDSCDISVMPAATLLLPYFEVDLGKPVMSAKTTRFSVINTSQLPQIARTTLWTDLGYPVFTFNIFLTGYDVQAIDLYDVVGRGILASERGTSNANTPGRRSLANAANPNFFLDAAETCSIDRQPVVMPDAILAEVRDALLTGRADACGAGQRIGRDHGLVATGYVTIDVVATCSDRMPDDPRYFNELLYDNVLAGEYLQLDPADQSGRATVAGNPLVHLRAIPEGGPPGLAGDTFLPVTFYSRFTPRTTPVMDRRQPLPSVFAARWIDAAALSFRTELQIWREGVTGSAASCAAFANNELPFASVVRFDERENATAYAPPPGTRQVLPLASRTEIGDAFWRSVVPPSGEPAGWLYLDLHNGEARRSQNWVSTRMSAADRFGASTDATMLSNGCAAGGDR